MNQPKTKINKELLTQDILYCNSKANEMYLAGDYERGEYYSNEAKRMSGILADMR